jgi:Predicted unsaturated glucuronyl hydrolase involved in regulation of bacterial surface properties, and related proteins
MKRIISFTILLVLAFGCRPEPISVMMVKSEMKRNPDASYLDGMEGVLKWNYTTGLELQAFLDVYEAYGGKDIYNYARRWYDDIIGEDGSIGGKYKMSNYNLDHLCPGRTLFTLQEIDPDPKFDKAIDTLRLQLEGQPRNSVGGFWHKKVYPEQMWLDGLYMGEPFYALYAAVKETDSLKREAIYADINHQFLTAFDGTLDPMTGLLRHAYDDSRQMFWCTNPQGQSAHSWGRAMGWYTMALLEVLDVMPEDSQYTRSIKSILEYVMGQLLNCEDPVTGMWYQVLDSPAREGNYLEASCSAMFTYCFLKAARKDYIPDDMKKYAANLYKNFIKYFVIQEKDKTLTIRQCCAVAGLGGKENRKGDYDYYINEKIVENDPKAIGPFIWASLEYEKYYKDAD